MVASHHDYDLGLIDLSRLTRELHAAIHTKVTAGQLGEAFEGLETGTNERHEHKRAA